MRLLHQIPHTFIENESQKHIQRHLNRKDIGLQRCYILSVYGRWRQWHSIRPTVDNPTRLCETIQLVWDGWTCEYSHSHSTWAVSHRLEDFWQRGTWVDYIIKHKQNHIRYIKTHEAILFGTSPWPLTLEVHTHTGCGVREFVGDCLHATQRTPLRSQTTTINVDVCGSSMECHTVFRERGINDNQLAI